MLSMAPSLKLNKPSWTEVHTYLFWKINFAKCVCIRNCYMCIVSGGHPCVKVHYYTPISCLVMYRVEDVMISTGVGSA